MNALNRLLVAAPLACLPLLFAQPAHAAASPGFLTVAVFDFAESKDEGVNGLGSKISTMVAATLSSDPNLITVERAELEKILSEHELGLSGSVSADSSAKVGQLTGAKIMVTGRVFKMEQETIMVAKIIGTETSRVYGEMVKGKAGSVSDLSGELAKKISAILSEKGDTLIAKVESREDRIARIKKSFKSEHLPSVSVKIEEQHFGQPVIDPAAETELGLLLTECGFKLVNEKSPEKADIEITGSAFSAYGMRKGNLITCRARVEIKAQRRNGELLVERQTSVGLDIAEQTSAKTGLENAASQLAERLLPKLAK